MFDHLFIAEKPSLAEEVARARAEQIGVSASKGSTHWTVGPDAVTWLAGHMYEQAQPQEYDPKWEAWSISVLPIVPPKWKLKPHKDKASRLKDIGRLIKDAKNVVNVGDAGREGQLLVDEVLLEAGRDPFKADGMRLWVKSLARKDMLDALGSMFPNSQKRTLYNSAIARQRADWLHGLNMTRLYTALARNSGLRSDKPMSVGRVQTPTLRLVVDRDREIAKFKPVDHYVPTGVFEHAKGSFRAAWIIPPDYRGTDSEGRLIDKKVAEEIATKVAGKTGPVESFEVKKKTKAPPLPYALSSLQKEASAKFGLGAAQTLEIAQSLYEKKVTTYPRSDSQHLPMSIYDAEAPHILDNLGKMGPYGTLVDNCTRSLKSGAWNDAKISDHHAIIPTTEATSASVAGLSDIERKVFDLIAKTFLAQFYPDHRWDSMSAIVNVEGERFKGTGKRITDQGWKVVYGASTDDEKEEDEEDEQALPPMVKGDPVKAGATKVDSKRTTPPSHFTEGTLIDAMRNVHRFVPDSEAKKKLKESSGIGTEATRSNILEVLKKREFLKPKGKFIVSTPVSQDLIDALDARLKDPALTALWEEQLDLVNKGELTVEAFLDELVTELTSTVKALAHTTLKIAGAREMLPGSGEICPKCGIGHLQTRTVGTGANKGKQFLSCDNYSKDGPNSCDYSRWPEEKITPIEGDGDACPKCGKGVLRTRVARSGDHKGKSYLACDRYKKDSPDSCDFTSWPKSKVEALPGDGEVCPQCGVGHMRTRMVAAGDHKGKRFLSCDAYKKDDPKACRYSAWPTPQVEALPGDGNVCPQCKKGHLRTRKSQKSGDRFLSCDAYDKNNPNSCRYSEWPKPKIAALPGDGEVCAKCRNGHMRSKSTKDGRVFLSCDGWRKDDPQSCNNSVWPDDGGKKSFGGAKPGGKPSAGAKPAATPTKRPGLRRMG